MKQTVRPHSMRAWILAARPKTLPAAAVPVLLGCALALAEGGFRWSPALLCLLFALLMQIDANLINDLFDYLGMEHNRNGDLLGWDTETTLEIETFYASKLDEDGMPCLVLDYATPPKWLGY